ncbi:peptidyl-prolyl cis-trans isomerase A-like isoform X1 [Schistocerca gregaria]|uniref:peptidyl-prolyl cis-trans isomerase A-like isoform X1 n=1 Tax=Schistocerca gregaria TaxID=7010 RepID=UPI00211E2E6A|nr:peptidyl-prolyl cis-trans isomerase A-like isoform X1 [Schistocerca gregaria]
MRQSSSREFKIHYIQPRTLSAEKKWSLARSYWAHIESIMRAKKILDNNNEEVWRFAEKQIEEHHRKRKKDEKRKSKENRYYFKKIKDSATHHRREDQTNEWKREQVFMKHLCKRPVLWTLKKERDILLIGGPECEAAGAPRRSVPKPVVDFKLRPRCFFDLQIDNDIRLGRIIFELYGDYVPKAAANFLSMCKGCDGLTYKGSCFHRIIPGLMCQGGDITEFNGSGGMTIFGEVFSKENYSLKHGGIGVLSMTGVSPTKISSLFNITFRELHALDGSSVVIGKVLKGINTLLKIEEFGYRTGKPRKKVVIAKCGQI